ncbi:MAG: hypothetical protein ACT4TC_22565 [Myxococcaceae bacterium]
MSRQLFRDSTEHSDEVGPRSASVLVMTDTAASASRFWRALIALLVVAPLGCVTLKKRLEPIKHVALVQYALDPGDIEGTPRFDVLRTQAADANVKALMAKLGERFKFTTLEELSINVDYQIRGNEKLDGYLYTAPGMRFILEGDENERAELHGTLAAKLCLELGVDAVMASAEKWTVRFEKDGFRAQLKTQLVLNLYDKSGKRLWHGEAEGESQEGMGATDGVISTDALTLALNAKQASGAALDHLYAQVK